MMIETNTTPVYWANKKAYDKGIYRVIANQGSTRSSKTFSLSQLMIDIASGGINQVTGQHYGRKEISVVSPSLPHLKKGARKDVLSNLETQMLFMEDNFNRTDQIYTFPATGSYIEFFGADDSQKVRGPGRDILYINEANLLNRETYIQLALRTREMIFMDFNPADEYSWVYEVADKTGNKLIISTYKNNLANLSKEQIAEIEALKDADENLWKVFGLGQRGTSSETIYTHFKVIDEMPERGEQVMGQDFGYNVPSALIDIEFYEGGLYWDEVLYEPKLTTTDLIERYKALKVKMGRPIYCDAAEPKTIEELVRAGYNAMPADKDVTEGIRKVKSMPLYITKRSINLLKEARSYKWKVDKDGRVLDEPVKFNDHAMDAGRYGTFTHLTGFQFVPVGGTL
ncbi:PBSX family phage terminase large subunit [Paraflavitalea pollutisoli]|uniref:PBSX family phage terminase large subunit n=1 Tax=Paraflavitalea pollutisoli TaxID=3034143 RepID=UPI0023EBB287|nr:phage terminase large subunit [Paraflavitalea sp. H1-2-19X]